MAAKKASSSGSETALLKQQVENLKQENGELKKELTAVKTSTKPAKKSYNWLRKTGIVFFLTLSIVTFMLFNLSSWVKNTLLDTDTFVSTMQPVLQQPAVQQTLQSEITNALFDNVDVQAKLQDVLPENIAFLSAPLASQIKSYTSSVVGTVLGSPRVYDLWGKSLDIIHSRLIGYIQNDERDGVLSVNDVYTAVSDQISSDSRLNFLTNRQLPDKVGTITLAEIGWLPQARQYVDMLTITPIILLLVSLLSGLAAVLLSLKKRRTFIVIAGLSIIMMFATLAAIDIGGQKLTDSVRLAYRPATAAIYDTVTNPLEDRTMGYAALLSALVLITALSYDAAWLRKARYYVDDKILILTAKVLPRANIPPFMESFSHYITVICWTVFSVLFVILGVRIPPIATSIMDGLIAGAIAALVLYAVHVIVRTLNRPASK